MTTPFRTTFATTVFAMLAILTIGVPLAYSQSPTPEEEDALVDLDTIKEQVKQRIQDVVQLDERTSLSNAPVAYVGSLVSITTNTLTIKTNEGTQLASTSAVTVVESYPDEDALDLSDMALDAYVAALGFSTDTQVLDARYIIVHDEKPQDETTRVFYGVIVDQDLQDDVITLRNPATNEQLQLTFGKKSLVRYQVSSTEEEEGETDDELPMGQPALVLYTPSDDDDELPVVSDLLVNQVIEASQLESISSLTASDSAQPPELEAY